MGSRLITTDTNVQIVEELMERKNFCLNDGRGAQSNVGLVVTHLF